MAGNSGYSDKLTIAVSCASGVESVLKKELYRLFRLDCPVNFGKAEFNGDAYSVAKCNICLRTADRVYIKVAEFTALSFDELFDGTYSVFWEDYITADGAVSVNGNCLKSKLFSISDCQKIIKKAVAKRLSYKYGYSVMPENGAEYRLEFSIRQDVVSIYINTSGIGLHKRGYRDRVGIAPIKETLACAMLLSSDIYKDRPFADPFCGSGTFLIEGARIVKNIAPGLDRSFAFNGWKNFPQKEYVNALKDAKDAINNVPVDFRGFDVDKKAIELTERHIRNAGLTGQIKAEVRPVKEFTPWAEYGTIVTNPPYGERVFDKEQAHDCYRQLGERLKDHSGWSLFCITPDNGFEKLFGRKSDRHKKLYNSGIECKYYYYYGKKENHDGRKTVD